VVVDAGQPGLGRGGRGAEEVAQGVADHRRVHVDVAALVEHVVAQRVEAARDPGTHLTRPEHPAVLGRGGGDHGPADPRPARGQGGVQQPDEVDEVGGDAARWQPVQGGVDGEADQPDRAVLVDEDVLGDQAAVGEAGVVGQGQGVGHLGHDPRGHGGGEGFAVGQHDVEAGA
jgi:hypothetical protein